MMTPERWQQVKGVMQEALEIASEQRPAFLDRACSTDHSLRREVESLLSSSNDVRSSFMRSSPHADLRLSNETVLGDFEVLSLIGAGGMGEIYRARDRRLDRDVAIKVLPRFVSFDPERLHRFEQEAKAAAALNHPNILAVFQMGTHEGAPYLVSELLEGETLREQVKHGPIPPRKAIDYGVQVACGLAAAHEKGIIHRDLKPENLFVTRDGRIKILDFGLAKLTHPESETQLTKQTLDTEPGAVLGTVGYMAPEQVRGQTADQRADIFAFGAILYEMISGKRAFQGETTADTLSAILNQEPRAISKVAPSISRAIAQIVHRCLEKNPASRYQSAAELTSTLEESAMAPQALWGSRRWRWHAWIFPGVAALVLVALPILGLNLGGWRDHLRLTTSAVPIDSLAVLPLTNLSGDPQQDYFVDGMTDELTTNLAQIGGLRVISRTSVMQFKDTKKPLPQIAKELNVQAVVEGSVVRSGDRLRITVQLVQASPEKHLWADSYERYLNDVLTLQDQVARDIATKIRGRLTPQDQAHLANARPVDPETYEDYLKGRYYYEKLSVPGFQEGLRYYRRAVTRDPNYAPAFVGLAASYKDLGVWGELLPREAASKSKLAVEKALSLDDALGEGHATLGHIHFLWDWEWASAEREYKRALELDPPSSLTRIQFAIYLSAMGRHSEALQEMKDAHAIDPVSHPSNGLLGAVYYWAHRFDDAIGQFQKTLELYPDSAIDHKYLGACYEQKGMYTQAFQEYQRQESLGGATTNELARRGHSFATSGMKGYLREKLQATVRDSRIRYVPSYDIAELYARLGQNEQAFEFLEKAYQERDHNMAFIKVEPMLDGLGGDPRFQELLRHMNLPYKLASIK